MIISRSIRNLQAKLKSQQQAQAQREEVYFAIYITINTQYKINATYDSKKAYMLGVNSVQTEMLIAGLH